MTNPASALDQVMADAEAAAGSLVPVPVPGNAAGLVPAYPANTNLAKPSMDSFLDAGGMDVDAYFRVKPEGFRIGDTMQGLIEDVEVEIDLTEVTPVYCARFETGGNTVFIRSYDGERTPDGKNFQAEVDRLTRINQKASGVYPTAEIPCTLLADVADPKAKSDVVIDEGTRVGYTPSVTGFKPFQSFMRKVRTQNPALLNEKVRVKLVHEKKVNSKKNEWGVLNFELIEG
jgi:hypothetical protein